MFSGTGFDPRCSALLKLNRDGAILTSHFCRDYSLDPFPSFPATGSSVSSAPRILDTGLSFLQSCGMMAQNGGSASGIPWGISALEVALTQPTRCAGKHSTCRGPGLDAGGSPKIGRGSQTLVALQRRPSPQTLLRTMNFCHDYSPDPFLSRPFSFFSFSTFPLFQTLFPSRRACQRSPGRKP